MEKTKTHSRTPRWIYFDKDASEEDMKKTNTYSRTPRWIYFDKNTSEDVENEIRIYLSIAIIIASALFIFRWQF